MTRLTYGCFYPDPNKSYNFPTVEAQVGAFPLYHTFISFDSTVAGHPEIAKAAQAGKSLYVSWGPSRTIGLTFADILAGKFDAHIDSWVSHLASLGVPVVIRFAWEMNGSWSKWSPLYSSTAADSSHCTSAQQYSDVWRYIVGRSPVWFRWFWCANANDVPYTWANGLERFYPGSAVVDIIGYDNYNGLSGWFSAAQIFAGYTGTSQTRAYDRVKALHSTAEIWLGETNCVDSPDPVAAGHSKADWYTAALHLDPTAYALPRLTTAVWFDSKGSRATWPFDSSAAALAAFRAAHMS